MLIDDLESRGIASDLIQLWKRQGIQNLTPCQETVLSFDPLWMGSNLIIVAPTSAGKTFMGEVLAARSALGLHRAIFLVPFKAIAEEKYTEFRERYEELGISVVISDGDHNQYDHDIRMGNFGLAVIVYEKLAQLLVQSPGILADCRILIVDEIQLMGDQNRGPGLELLLAHFRQLPERPQIIGLSATLDDLGELDKWLDAEVVVSSERPVPLWEGVASPAGAPTLVDVESGATKFGPSFAGVRSPSALPAGSAVDLAYRVMASEGFNKSYLLFRTRVDDTIRSAQDLAYVLPSDPVPAAVRDRINELEDTATRAFLDQWIDHRVAYHNGGLSLEERRLIEQLFNEGTLRILVATSTLAAGVNTPADVVLILDYRRWNQQQESQLPIPVGEYKNSVGRAGRFGISAEGRSYLLALRPAESKLLAANYIHGRPKALRSAMPTVSEPERLVLSVVARGLAADKQEVRDAFRNSFAYNYYFDCPDDADAFLVANVEAIDHLLNNELLTEERGKLSVTPLGRVAAASGLSIRSFSGLVDLFQSEAITFANVNDLIDHLCDFSELQSFRPYDDRARANLLRDWTGGIAVVKIADRYSGRYAVGYGNIRAIGSAAAWILRTAEQTVVHLDLGADREQLRSTLADLAVQCLFGVPTEMVPVAALGVLRRSEVMQLYNNRQGKQFTSLHELLETPAVEFVGILSAQRVDRLRKAIENQIGESLARHRTGHLYRAEKIIGLRPLVEGVYASDGEDFERALEDFLNASPLSLGARRFTRQRRGQPDLEIVGNAGTVVVQATASRDGNKPVSWDKAREVSTSVGYSGRASNFVCIGRPVFHDVAVGNANETADRGDSSLLLLPLSDLVELCLREAEGESPAGTVLNTLENEHGHYSNPDAE